MGRVGVATAGARRGGVVLVAVGVNAAKPRPAVIEQEDLFANTNCVTRAGVPVSWSCPGHQLRNAGWCTSLGVCDWVETSTPARVELKRG